MQTSRIDISFGGLSSWRYRVLNIVFLIAVVLLLCPWLWQAPIDSYAAYSGFVVEKGIERHLFGLLRGSDRYLILRDENGKMTKRYVDHDGYAFTHVGTYVVKKKGLGEYPRTPGERTPGELMRALELQKQELKQK